MINRKSIMLNYPNALKRIHHFKKEFCTKMQEYLILTCNIIDPSILQGKKIAWTIWADF